MPRLETKDARRRAWTEGVVGRERPIPAVVDGGGGGERKGFLPPGRRRRRSERGKKKTSRRRRSFEPKSLDRQFSASPSSLSSFSLTCPLACPRPFLLLGLRDPGAGDRFPKRRRSPVEVSAAAEATRTMRRPAATTGVARAAVDDGDESAEPRLAETDVSCFFLFEVSEKIGIRVAGSGVSGLEKRRKMAAVGKGDARLPKGKRAEIVGGEKARQSQGGRERGLEGQLDALALLVEPFARPVAHHARGTHREAPHRALRKGKVSKRNDAARGEMNWRRGL